MVAGLRAESFGQTFPIRGQASIFARGRAEFLPQTVAGDGADPGAEIGPRFVLVEVQIRINKHLLDEVLGGVAVAEHRGADAPDRLLKKPHEAGERLCVASQHLFDNPVGFGVCRSGMFAIVWHGHLRNPKAGCGRQFMDSMRVNQALPGAGHPITILLYVACCISCPGVSDLVCDRMVRDRDARWRTEQCGVRALSSLRQNAIAEGEAIRERERLAHAAARRHLNSVETAALQAQIDRHNAHIAALYQLLVARGVFTAEEAKRLVTELETAGKECPVRDLVTGTALPPEENPFRELVETSAERGKRHWRLRLRTAVRVAGFLVLACLGLAAGVFLAWLWAYSRHKPWFYWIH